ncbi:DNA polymerase III subunit theta [Atlantibacter subterraneus]|uniref:DNA polymerase III subunit theta n=1 Tax=Atlantibacter subterraneus TaxID=255519 RepID=UPI002FDE7BC9
MSQWNIAKLSKEEQDKVAVDLVASGVAYKERLNMPVIAEAIAREQPEHLRESFMERLRHYRQVSTTLSGAGDLRYAEMKEASSKK